MKEKILFAILLLTANFVYAQEKFVYKPEGLRDPFSALVTSDGRIIEKRGPETKIGVAELYLEGIIFDSRGNSFVLMNGKVYKVGDLISDYRIFKIGENSITVIKDDIEYKIMLQKKYDVGLQEKEGE